MKKSFKQKVSFVLAGAMTLSSVMVNTSVANAEGSVTTGIGTKTTTDNGYKVEWDLSKIYNAATKETNAETGAVTVTALPTGDIGTWLAGGVADEFGFELGDGFLWSDDDHTTPAAVGKVVGTDKSDAGYADEAVTTAFPDVAEKKVWIAGGANPKYSKGDGTYGSATDGSLPTQGGYFKFTAPENITSGELEWVMKIGVNKDDGSSKKGYLLGSDGNAIMELTGTGGDKSYYFSFNEVEAGETYYIFAQGSKTRFSGLRFTAVASNEDPADDPKDPADDPKDPADDPKDPADNPDPVVTPAAATVEYYTNRKLAGSEEPANFDGIVFELVPENEVEKIAAGETFKVDFKISNNKAGLRSMTLIPVYDKSIATLESIEVNEDIDKGNTGKDILDAFNEAGNTITENVEKPITATEGTWMTLTFKKVTNGDFNFFFNTEGSLAGGEAIDFVDYVVKGCVVKLEDKETVTESSSESTTEATTAAATEATTKAATTETTTETTTTATTTKESTTETTTRRSSSGGGSGGGGGSSSRASSNNDSLKPSTSGTKTDTSDSNKGSNQSTAVQPSFSAPNGVKIAPPTQAVYSKTFNDLTGRDWAASAINKLASLGIINGVAEGKFDPDAGSKRADFIIMLDKILGLSGTATDNFDDIESGKYYANYVGLAKQAGVASGYGDGNFGPEKSLTRQDMMVLVAKTLEFCGEDISADTSVLSQFGDEADMADYAKPFAAYLVSQGMVNGTGSNIEGTKDMTRAQMAVLMSKLYDKIYEIALANYNAEQAAAAAAAEEATEAESSEESTEAASEETTSEETTSEVSTSEETTEETTEATTEA